jgi:CheY-like chemotaxis protein
MSQNSHPIVFVAEDDDYTRQICLRLLEKNGYTCRGFASAEELLNSGEDADVVLTDIHLPGISGMELCRRLKRQTKARVIALSGNGDLLDIIPAPGFDGILVKPFTEKTLLEALGNAQAEHAEIAFPQLERIIDDPEERRAILLQFRIDTHNDLMLLETAASQDNLETMELVAHRLVGRFAQLEQPALAADVKKLEMQLNRGKYGRSELEKAVNELRKFLQKLKV